MAAGYRAPRRATATQIGSLCHHQARRARNIRSVPRGIAAAVWSASPTCTSPWSGFMHFALTACATLALTDADAA